MSRAGSRRMRGWAAVSAGVLVAASALGAVPAAGQEAGGAAGIQLSPAFLEKDVDSDRIDVKVSVRNNDPVARTVDVRVVGLGHGLDGTPWVLDSEPATHLHLDPVRVRLEPAQTRELVVAGSLDGDGGGFYGAVTAEAVVEGDELSGVAVRTRVAGSLLLRGPQPWDQRIEIEDVVLRPVDGGDYEVAAVVRDHGDVHVRPTGTLRILKGDEVLHTVTVDGSYYVLPGYARRLGGRWTPPSGLEGPLTVEATFDGAGSQQRSIAFPVTGPAPEDPTAPAAMDKGEGATLSGGGDGSGEASGAASSGNGGLWAVAAGLVALAWSLLLLLLAGRRRRRAVEPVARRIAAAAARLAASAPQPPVDVVLAVEADAQRAAREAAEAGVLRSWPVSDVVAAAIDLGEVAAGIRNNGTVDLVAAARIDRWLLSRDPHSALLADALCGLPAPEPVPSRA